MDLALRWCYSQLLGKRVLCAYRFAHRLCCSNRLDRAEQLKASLRQRPPAPAKQTTWPVGPGGSTDTDRAALDRERAALARETAHLQDAKAKAQEAQREAEAAKRRAEREAAALRQRRGQQVQPVGGRTGGRVDEQACE